jgi:WD40 repeat protein
MEEAMRQNLLRLVGTLAALALTAVSLSVPLAGRSPGGAGKPRLDAYGDPLPPGATARFGSLRWRMPGSIGAVAVSPNGERVAAVNMYGRVAIWDMATGRRLHEFAGSEAGEGCLAFSPDGRYLATGGQYQSDKQCDYRVRVWDVRTGKQRASFSRQDHWIGEVAFSPDGKGIVSAGSSQPVIIWEFPSGNKLREFVLKPGGWHRFTLSPNGRWLAVADPERILQVHDFDTGRRLLQLKTQDYLHGFRFSADSRSLLVVESQTVSYWELATGKARWRRPMSDAFGLRFHPAPDARKIAVTGNPPSGDIHWLDACTGKLHDSWPAPRDWLSGLAFSEDGRTILTGGWGTVRVWDAATGKIVRGPAGPENNCHSLVFSPDGRTLVAGSTDLLFLDGRTLQERYRSHVEVKWPLVETWHSVEVSPNGALAAAVGPKGKIVLVQTQTGKPVRTVLRPGWYAASLAFGPDSKKLYAVAHTDAALRVWDVGSGTEDPPLCTDLVRTDYSFANVAVDQARGKLATVTRGPMRRCRFWDLRTGREEASLNETGEKLLFSRDGKLLAAYHHNSHINVWDLARRVRRLRLDFGLNTVMAWAFSQDGRLLVTGHWDGALRTWNLASGKKVAEIRGHPTHAGIIALACSPDGKGLVSACSGCTVLRWDASAWQGK